jgi:hypothetical protein
MDTPVLSGYYTSMPLVAEKKPHMDLNNDYIVVNQAGEDYFFKREKRNFATSTHRELFYVTNVHFTQHGSSYTALN